jgi:hypothetical protein
MADISDVEQAIAGAITDVLYPGGASQSSIIGVLCRIYRGWPNGPTLNTDLTAGAVNVTVITDNDSGKTTTRYLPEWRTNVVAPGTVASVIGQKISISGSPEVGDLVGALIDGTSFTYRVQKGDTSDQVASNITQAIQATHFANVQGTTITVHGATSITARTVRDHSSTFESRRQEKDVRVVCWCPSPLVRDSISGAIDYGLGQIHFLPLSDGTSARVVYRNTSSYDQAQNALLYRRDLVYTIEYPTVTIVQQPSMLFGACDINGNIIYG